MNMKTQPTDTDEVISKDGATDIDYIDVDVNENSFWLELASTNFKVGTDYQQSALVVQWERNADHFNSKHFRRSPYNSKMYKGRSRIFRPLSRSAERASSAQAAAALFSNMDIIDVQPENVNDPEQVFSAKIIKKLVEYYLDKKIPWYLTCLGAWQDTRVYGPCCSFTDWRYHKVDREIETPVLNMQGLPSTDGRTETKTIEKVLKDEPYINLIPVENILLDPACDWRDPINSSPYVVYLMPMALSDVQARMESGDWKQYSKAEILSVSRDHYNTVRQAREGDNRPDKHDSQERDEFKSIWVHYNFVRLNGEEYFYITLGTTYLLTDVVYLEDEYITGVRPFSYGFSVLEAHKFSPSSPIEMISGLQTSVNDISNLRIDNIRLALNKRYIIRRGATVDLEALMRSVPGGGVMTDDVEKDIKVLDTRDVTGSSYKEQEHLETESNDITGHHMGSSIQNNRNLNQTVGGMELLAEGASALSDFDIRTFSESWVKPQLELLIQNIQAYVDDEEIKVLALQGAESELKFIHQFEFDDGDEGKKQRKEKEDSLLNHALKQKLTVKVNVGLGATSPQRKVTTLLGAVSAAVQLPDQGRRLNTEEITKEIFTASGLADGNRFIKPEDAQPELTEEDLQAAMEQGVQQGVDQVKQQQIEANLLLGQQKLELERELGYAQIAAKEQMTLAQLEAKLQVDLQKDQTRRDVEALKGRLINSELEYKRRTGKPGI